MNRFFPALTASISLVALAGVGYVLTRDLTVPDSSLAVVELDVLRARLKRLEDRVESPASFSRDGESVAPSGEARAELGEDGVELAEGDDSPTAESALLARLETIETRLRGLEGDPVQRAFTYLQSGNAELRMRGVRNLESLAKSDPEARAALHDMLTDVDAGVRAVALDTLADIDDEEVIPTAVELLSDDVSDVRREAINTLTRLDAKDAAAEIAPFISDENDDVRRLAVDSMGKLGYEDSAAALLSALEDPNARVRGEAISSLGEIGASESLSTLRELFTDQTEGGAHKEADHRVRLAMAMKQLGDRTAAQAEIARLGDLVHYRENGGAMRALMWIGRDEPAATEIFRKAAEVSRTEWIRREARRMLQEDKRDGRE